MTIMDLKRLFRQSEPRFIEFDPDLHDEIFWEAYRLKSFDMESDLDYWEVIDLMHHRIAAHQDAFMAYDDGVPVGIIVADIFAGAVEPHLEYFRWASARAIIRVEVAFLTRLRFADSVDKIIIYSYPSNVAFFSRLVKYLPIVSQGLQGDGRHMFVIEGAHP